VRAEGAGGRRDSVSLSGKPAGRVEREALRSAIDHGRGDVFVAQKFLDSSTERRRRRGTASHGLPEGERQMSVPDSSKWVAKLCREVCGVAGLLIPGTLGGGFDGALQQPLVQMVPA